MMLYVFSLGIFLLGGACIAGSLWAHFFGAYYGLIDLISYVYNVVWFRWAVLGFGCGLILVSFMGCGGAAKKNGCLLGMFSLIMGVLGLGLVVVGALSLVYKEKVNTTLTARFEDYTLDPALSYSEGFQRLESAFKCCGLTSNNASDCYQWKNNEPIGCGCDYSQATAAYCSDKNANANSCVISGVTQTGIFTRSCLADVTQSTEDITVVVGIVGIIAGVICLLGMLFGFWSFCTRNKY